MDYSHYNFDITKPNGWNRTDPNSANVGSFSSSWISPTTMKHLKIFVENILLKIKCPCCAAGIARLTSSIVTHNEVEAIHISYVCSNCKEEFTDGKIDEINLSQFNPGNKKQLVISIIKSVLNKTI